MSISSTDQNKNNDYMYTTNGSCGISEIEEEHEEYSGSNSNAPSKINDLVEIKRFEPMLSINEEHEHNNVIYVAVGRSASSVDALDWTLKNVVNFSSTRVYLIHIYSEVKQIPTPLGKLPLNQVSPEQVETYMAQERDKRRELLQKFLYKCLAANVNVDTVLIESDTLPKTILDLIDILQIRKLVVGTTKSSLRKLRSRKGTGTADQILKSAPEACEVKIICEGNEVVMIDQAVLSPTQQRRSVDISKASDNSKSVTVDEEEDHYDDKRNDAISCICFKSK